MAQHGLKQKWYQKIRIVEAQTELGQMYYLMDEELNFIPYVKEYLNMIQAKWLLIRFELIVIYYGTLLFS